MEHEPPVRRPPLELGALKALPLPPFEPLDPDVRYFWMLGRVISSVVVGIFSVLVFFYYRDHWPDRLMEMLFLLGLVGVIALANLLWPFVAYRFWGIALRETDVLIREGVIWRRVVAIPFSRIQHVDSQAGPLARSMGLANLIIHTAGSSEGGAVVPGLPAERAEALRDYLSMVGHSHANL